MGLTPATPRSMTAVVQRAFGGPEVLQVSDVTVPEASVGETLVEVALSGVNFGDLHGRRAGSNHIAVGTLPFIPGSEVVGRRVDSQQRVLALSGLGGYAGYVAVASERVFPVPDDVDDATALSLFVSGLTAWYLLRSNGGLTGGQSVAVYAASGSVGALAVQLAVHLGAGRVIGTASSTARREAARVSGAHVVVDSRWEGLADRLVQANEGRPVDLVLDCSGGPGFTESLAALAPRGRLVLFGTPSGPPAPVSPASLVPGSRSIAGFWLMDLFAVPGMVEGALDELFELSRSGVLRPCIGQVFPLTEVARAHQLLEARASLGKVLLQPVPAATGGGQGGAG